MDKDSKAINSKDFDASVKPADNFYQYANGGWLKRCEIPDSESRWGSFNILHEDNEKKLHGILEELSKLEDLEPGSNRQKLRDYYRSGMDEEKIEKDGLLPVRGELESIEALKDKEDLPTLAALLHASGVGVCFGVAAEQDEKDASRVVPQFFQGGLGLPDREYYIKEDKASEEIRRKYREHLKNMFVLLDEDENKSRELAENVFRLEKTLAEHSKPKADLRDIEKNYHRKTPRELASLTPDFRWEKYFEKAGMPEFEYSIVGQPEFFEALSGQIKDIPLETWKAYFRLRFAESVSGKLSGDFVNEVFDFYRVFSGASELRPRWKRVISEVNTLMSEALGKEFVDQYFSAESKERVKEMIEYIRTAYRERIENLEWMQEETKKHALAKLEKIIPKIGYPDEWRDYSKLEIKPDAYVQNHLRACRFEFAREMAKIGKPVDYGEWLMPPATVNACFHPTKQEITFPAGILQPPFFYSEADDAVNYGAIGMVIGHELTHGFDDQGRKFNEHGNLHDWWNEKDAEEFEKRSEVLRKQFDAYEALPGHCVNGRLTLGENVADLGGAVIAYHAFQKSLEGKEPSEKIDNLTAEERFFLSWAKMWQMKIRDSFVKNLLVIDPHSPPQFRVNGPASNMEEFYEVFGVKEGDGLYRKPEDRVKIW